MDLYIFEYQVGQKAEATLAPLGGTPVSDETIMSWRPLTSSLLHCPWVYSLVGTMHSAHTLLISEGPATKLCRNASFSLLGSDLNLTQLVRNFALLCYFSLCKRTKEGMKLEQKMFAHCLLFPRLPCRGAAVTSCSPPSRNNVRHLQTACRGG